VLPHHWRAPCPACSVLFYFVLLCFDPPDLSSPQRSPASKSPFAPCKSRWLVRQHNPMRNKSLLVKSAPESPLCAHQKSRWLLWTRGHRAPEVALVCSVRTRACTRSRLERTATAVALVSAATPLACTLSSLFCSVLFYFALIHPICLLRNALLPRSRHLRHASRVGLCGSTTQCATSRSLSNQHQSRPCVRTRSRVGFYGLEVTVQVTLV
jgi:hypothetical protein